MSLTLLGILGIVILFVLIFLNVPVGFSLAGIGFLGVCVVRGFDSGLNFLGVEYYRTASTYVFSVIPLFIGMGFVASEADLSRQSFRVIRKFIGHRRGGMAMASTVACSVFAAICGDSIATATTIGSVSLPEMRRYKYKDTLSLGCIAAGGNLGFLIPPSLGFIFYAILTEQSVGILFISGILPGVLLTVLFLIAIWIWCRLDKDVAPASDRFGWGERIRSLHKIISALVLILLILGGIYLGFFTPTEAGAVGLFGVLMVGIVTRSLSMGGFIKAMFDSAMLVGRIFILITGAIIFGRFITFTEIPPTLAQAIVDANLHPNLVLCVVLAFYVLIGFVMDIMSIILLAAPILHPILVQLGFDPVWLAAATMVTVLMGNISPPVGIVVYAMSGFVADASVFTIFRGTFPFLGMMLIGLILMILFPQIALFLPNLMSP
jgi:tripartite ATP-independent transporter DctM subunit